MKMTWDDIVRKLTSRKFWAAVAEFVTMLLVALKYDQGSAEKVAALIMAGAAVIAYIVGEGLADAAGAKANLITTGPEEKPPEKASEEE